MSLADISWKKPVFDNLIMDSVAFPGATPQPVPGTVYPPLRGLREAVEWRELPFITGSS